jgi:O-antigen ligase
MLLPAYPRTPAPVVLIQVGAALLVLGCAVSLAASPDPMAGLPWALQSWLGATASWIAWRVGGSANADAKLDAGPAPGSTTGATEETRAATVARSGLALGYACLVFLPAVTRWPAYKFPMLTPVYGALPSLLRYAPTWAASGYSPNQTGGVLAAVAAFAVCLLFQPPSAGTRDLRTRGIRPAAGVLAVLTTIAVMLSGSRAALAALVLAVLFAFMLRDRRGIWVVAALVAAALAATAFRPSLPGEFVTRLLHEEPLQTKLLARVDIWASALRGIADHPFSGIGLGTLNEVLPVRYPYGSVGLSYTVTQAHNTFLDTALTTGVPGAFGLLLLIAGVVWTGVAMGREGTLTSSAIMGLTAAMVVFVVFGTTDALSLSSPSSLLIWALVSGLLYTGALQQKAYV